MSDSIEKTKALKRESVSIALLDGNPQNPNQMSDEEFNLLYDNIERIGIADPILVRRAGDRFRVVGGHHRLEVAKLQGFEEVPCTIIEDDSFDEDQEKFQIVRMNMIRGKLSPQKFLDLYASLAPKYSDEILRDAFGFADQEEFQKLVRQAEGGLPPELKKEFKKAAGQIKTIDDLSKVLNGLFSKYGSSLDYGYMLVDFGGKESVWLRMSQKTKDALMVLGTMCRENQRTMDAMLGGVVQLIAQGQGQDLVAKAVASSKPVDVSNVPADQWPLEENVG